MNKTNIAKFKDVLGKISGDDLYKIIGADVAYKKFIDVISSNFNVFHLAVLLRNTDRTLKSPGFHLILQNY